MKKIKMKLKDFLGIINKEHLEKAPLSILLTLFGTNTDFRLLQLLNAHLSIITTLFGIIIDFNLEQLENVQLFIFVILFANRAKRAI